MLKMAGLVVIEISAEPEGHMLNPVYSSTYDAAG